jgi:Protein of unknown function (DUF1549)/Protein of unknown function (DUF1553)/Planctomycete cytochrome C
MLTRLSILLLGASALAWGKLPPEQLAKLPPAATHTVDFSREIKPLLEASCIKCHGRGKAKGGWAIDNRETFLKGGDSGPAAIPGKGGESLVVEAVSGSNPDLIMPEKGSKFTPEQVGLLRAWIDQGMAWDTQVTFGRLPPINLHPRAVEPPSGSGLPVDRFIAAYFTKQGIESPAVVTDAVFARRAYLDTIGLLPSPEALRAFAEDKSPGKRARLVRQLLGRDMDYAQHWLSFWNDVLRNDYRGTGYIDGGRKQITGWLFEALLKNKPYDKFVAELIDPSPESEGFSKGIVWRGVVNSSQTPEMQAAQNISQVFMGVNLKCASCHDSFINDWTLADSYGLASVYAQGPLEMFKCDAPTGQRASMKFIFPELGRLDGESDRKARLKHLAGIVTAPENGRLTRTIVNRVWGRLMGRGLIDPVDEMDRPAWHPDLLDWLAQDLVANGYDLKHTLETIMTSRAYQLPAVAVSERVEQDFVFRGPTVRRLSAEQFVDAVSELTGVWERPAAAQLNFAALLGKASDPEFKDKPVAPRWIWKDEGAASKASAGTVYFRKSLNLETVPAEAVLVVSCDNNFKLFVNGTEAGSGKDHTQPRVMDIRGHLKVGANLIAVVARNEPGAPNQPTADQANPAGLWVYGHLRVSSGARAGLVKFGSDKSWVWSEKEESGWENPDFDQSRWQAAAELGSANIAPWSLGARLAQAVDNIQYARQVRSSLANNDALMTALGRPNREQVVTVRASAATTLQALELTNGSTLASELKQAGERIAKTGEDASTVANALYLQGVGRAPNAEELTLAKEVLGTPVRAEGVEDFLWAMTMLPDFQLIY